MVDSACVFGENHNHTLHVETSLQAQFLIPMAASIAFGLLFATMLVLLLVPCEYAILSRLGWARKIDVSQK